MANGAFNTVTIVDVGMVGLWLFGRHFHSPSNRSLARLICAAR